MKRLVARFHNMLISNSYLDSCVVIYGDSHAFIENIKRVCELDEFCVSVCTYSGDITIYGTELKAENCKRNSLNIYGKITSCEIKRREVL